MRLTGALIGLCLLVGCGEDSGSNSTAPPTPEPTPEARSPEDLAVEWWQWAVQRPAGEDPVSDMTGSRCTQDQPQHVFFLAGTSGKPAKRRCDVPADRPLFFPVINVLCPVDVGVDGCAKTMRKSEVAAEVDGKPVDTRWIVSQRFDPGTHPDSQFARVGDATVAAGHYALVDPLSPGRHTVEFAGIAPDGFAVAVRYRLQVD